MIKSKGRVEHRKHKRFQIPKGSFAALGPDCTKVGPVVDMSMRGLGFRYVGSEEPPKGSYVDIFLSEGDFYLGKVPIKTISDVEVVDKAPSSSTTLRRCGVKFGTLTQNQKAQLERFILYHTIGEA